MTEEEFDLAALPIHIASLAWPRIEYTRAYHKEVAALRSNCIYSELTGHNLPQHRAKISG